MAPTFKAGTVGAAGGDADAARRLERLRMATASAGLDAFLATSDESIAYLTGFRPLQLERFFGVVVRADGGGAVVVPKLDEGQVADAPASLERTSYTAASDGLSELAAALEGARSVGVEEDHLVFARSRGLHGRGFEPVPAGSILAGLRARKEAQEVARLRRAVELVEQALTWMFDELLRPGAVEQVVNARVESRVREEGATDAHPLILFGERAANPHGMPGRRELRAGDVVCADLSACLDGYWGDVTRCAVVGPASGWERDTCAVVREAQAAAIAVCRPGVAARDVDAAQRRIVEARPDLGECLHGAGHAIGLAVHEPPFLVPRSETPLEEGMVFTIEPGLYKLGTGGIRLEDVVLVGRDGPQVLSTLPLDLVELPAYPPMETPPRRKK